MPNNIHKYEVILYQSQSDQVFVADVPELTSCIAHGAMQQDALAQVQETQALWIESAQEYGDPVPEPKGRRLLFA